MSNFLGISWWLWAAIGSAIVALAYVFIVPNSEKVLATTGLQFFIVRWFHSIVWVLLGISCLMRLSENETLLNWANPVAALGGITYLVYIVSFSRL